MKNFLNYTVREVDGKLRLFDNEGNEEKTVNEICPDAKIYHTVWGVFQYKKENGLNPLVYDIERFRSEVPTAILFHEGERVGWKTPSRDLILPPIFYCIAIDEQKNVYTVYGNGEIRFWGDSDIEYKHWHFDDELIFEQNGKFGLKNRDGSILFPAIYDEIYSWDFGIDVYYTRIGNEFHYYNSKHEEILTTYRKFDGIDDKLKPYFLSYDKDDKVIVTMQLTPGKSDTQTCVIDGENVRLDRITKSEAGFLVKNNCEIWDNGVKQLKRFYNYFSKVDSVCYAQSKSDTPITDCINQLMKMIAYPHAYNYIIKIWTNRNTTISISQMNELIYFYLNDTNLNPTVDAPMDCIAIGYDDSLEDGMVKMFQVIYTNEREPNEFDEMYKDAISGTIDDYLGKMSKLLAQIEISTSKNDGTNDAYLYHSYLDAVSQYREIGGNYGGIAWEDELELLNYLIYHKHYSLKKTAFYVCRELFRNAQFNDFNEADIRYAFKKIRWAIRFGSDCLTVINGKTCLDYIQRAIEAVKKVDGVDSNPKIVALEEIEELLYEHNADTAFNLRSTNTNPLNMYFRLRRNDKDKPIAEYFDNKEIILSAQQVKGMVIEERGSLQLLGIKGFVKSIVEIYCETVDDKLVEQSRKTVSRVNGRLGVNADKYLITLSNVVRYDESYGLGTN